MNDFDMVRSVLLSDKWDTLDLRDSKESLVQAAQKALTSFTPINKALYANNCIQLIDFFSGAGGTSLGFAALNAILPGI